MPSIFKVAHLPSDILPVREIILTEVFNANLMTSIGSKEDIAFDIHLLLI